MSLQLAFAIQLQKGKDALEAAVQHAKQTMWMDALQFRDHCKQHHDMALRHCKKQCRLARMQEHARAVQTVQYRNVLHK